MQIMKCRITGVAPLLMHNGQLADRNNEWTRRLKEITSKRKKVDADYDEMAKLEWMGSLYLTDGVPCIPAKVLEGALIGRGGAARMEKMGKAAAASVWVMSDFPLIYDGPKDPKNMWDSGLFKFSALVKVQQARVMRTRPIFQGWGADIQIDFDEEFIDPDTLKRWLEVAGRQVGLMDWRPKYGRFVIDEG